ARVSCRWRLSLSTCLSGATSTREARCAVSMEAHYRETDLDSKAFLSKRPSTAHELNLLSKQPSIRPNIPHILIIAISPATSFGSIFQQAYGDKANNSLP
ncbi:hypothetical protein, partial [Shewanella sp. GXUN23E]|uniref:hypothetical protein n=1 Tax=Shewanella sp. GXUN23E TaxID=3422498 RepID=UPI003D7CDC27